MKMLKKSEVYELLKQEAMRTGKMGTETVTVRIPKDEFNTEYHYRNTLNWEIDDEFVLVTDEAK